MTFWNWRHNIDGYRYGGKIMGNTVRTITDPDLDLYRHDLDSVEKSRATTEKYIRDVKALKTYIGNQSITKGLIIAYKNHLQNHYKATRINSMLAGINSFLTFMGWQEYRVKQLVFPLQKSFLTI